GLTEGVTFFFVVTSADEDGLESDPSNEVAYLVPGIMRIQFQGGTNVPSISFPVAIGQRFELQATDDLHVWIPVWIVTGLANEWLTYRDVAVADHRQRFYRLIPL